MTPNSDILFDTYWLQYFIEQKKKKIIYILCWKSSLCPVHCDNSIIVRTIVYVFVYVCVCMCV